MSCCLPFLRRPTLAAVLSTAALLLAACGGGGGDDPSAEREGPAGAAPTANLALTSAATGVVLTSDSRWNLSKTGALSGNTVSWTVEVSRAPTIAGRLAIQGQMTVANSGSGAATIGNIVVNLQKRQGNRWVTAASDVADATQGDDATRAHIQAAASSENRATFTENGASGMLNFMDASNNTVFSLVPQATIAAGSSKTLLFTAVFDNNDAALQLTPGTAIRAEVIVTFGNATANGNSTANVDINGNGALDADEARVRSVPSRLMLTVPNAVNSDGSVVLTDTLDDIRATGDVQFSNVIFNLGATGGTVTANVTGGSNGGSITNCARLRSADQNVAVGGFSFPMVDGVDLQACSTVAVGGTPPTCTPGAPGCGWKTGDMQTATQGGWDSGAAANLFSANFVRVYGAALTVGGNFSMTFTNAAAVFSYLPASGTTAALNASLMNPLTTSSGELGGQVLALQLNSDFSSLLGNAVSFGELRICNLSSVPSVNGMTVGEFLSSANRVLGGGSASFGVGTAQVISSLLNNAFVDGAPSAFAQANLVAGPCPANWSVGQMRTFTQPSWGDPAGPAGTLLNANFAGVLGAAVVIGGTFDATLTSAGAVFNYLPATGTAASLTGNVQNPLTTSAGELGGEVLALQINVDFSATNVLPAVVPLGSLRFCNFTDVPSLNGQTVGQFLATANHLLGGGSAPLGHSTVAAIARRVNAAFLDGTPSTFAQASLVAASSCT